jgi:hypothetical protein
MTGMDKYEFTPLFFTVIRQSWWSGMQTAIKLSSIRGLRLPKSLAQPSRKDRRYAEAAININ